MYCVFPYIDLVSRSVSENESETNFTKMESENERKNKFQVNRY